ncbi:MAG: DUF3330 domain-containing protein [Gammaproteobacteria bacterium]|nr:DUF3330 domain-containing protein [Gammaproteobacteria bacterium]MDH5650503.1 DUF3330 domain-containing protein [Gammaproteobacteria bacterium]
MIDKTKTDESDTVPCNVCLKEIPLSAARSEESETYVLHFCGLHCYDKWRSQEESSEETASPK